MASFFLRELVDALMRQSQETSSIARAHLQFSGSQDADGASSRDGGPPVFFVGLLAKGRVGPNRPCRGTRQLHVIHDGGPASRARPCSRSDVARISMLTLTSDVVLVTMSRTYTCLAIAVPGSRPRSLQKAA